MFPLSAIYFTLKANKIITMDGDKSFAPVKKKRKVSLIEPKHFFPTMNVPTTNVSAMTTMPKPKSAKTGTTEKMKMTSNAVKKSVATILVFSA